MITGFYNQQVLKQFRTLVAKGTSRTTVKKEDQRPKGIDVKSFSELLELAADGAHAGFAAEVKDGRKVEAAHLLD